VRDGGRGRLLSKPCVRLDERLTRGPGSRLACGRPLPGVDVGGGRGRIQEWGATWLV
jgi:hypothetical protein